MKGWEYFRESMQDYKLPVQPKLRVYNLEDFLKDLEVNKDNDILFIPGLESYKHIEQQYLQTKGQTSLVLARDYTHSFFSTSQLWFRRIVLSLTSRQPPTW